MTGCWKICPKKEKGRGFRPCGHNALQTCRHASCRRRFCKEAHRVEQRDAPSGLRQGLSGDRPEV